MDRDILLRAVGSDPVVRFSIRGFPDQESTVIRKTVNPSWNESFRFERVVDSSLLLEVTIEDYNDIKMRSFMGKVTIPLNDFNDKKYVKKS